jgi:hypothetical protein
MKNMEVPVCNTIKNLVPKIRNTASATHKKPGGRTELCEHRKTLEVYVPLHVVAPDEKHV